MRHFPLAEVCRLQIVPWGTTSACSDGAPSRMRVSARSNRTCSFSSCTERSNTLRRWLCREGHGLVGLSHNASPCCAFCNSRRRRRRSRCPPPPPAPTAPPPPLLALVGGAAVAERALAVFLAPFRNATSRAKVRNRGRTYDRVGSWRPAGRPSGGGWAERRVVAARRRPR